MCGITWAGIARFAMGLCAFTRKDTIARDVFTFMHYTVTKWAAQAVSRAGLPATNHFQTQTKLHSMPLRARVRMSMH